MIKHLSIQVFGRVQGTMFRYSAKEKADQFNIRGIAKNSPDDSVYIEAEGEEKDLDQFVVWCHQGPQFAGVEKVEVKVGGLKNFSDFTIL